MRKFTPRLVLLLGIGLSGCGGNWPGSGDDDDTGDGSGSPQAVNQPEICEAVEPSLEELSPGVYTTQTEHYQLQLATGSQGEARRIARMAEMAFDAFVAYFPAEIDSSLVFEGELHATEADWGASIEADGLEPPWGAGGLYHPATGIAYAYVQPTRYYTRVLMLHELAHQFHHEALGEAVSDLPFWYSEGIAEFLGRHDWDEDCLRLGVLPLGTYEDFPRQAETQLSNTNTDLTEWVANDSFPGGRPLSTAFLRFLETRTETADLFRGFRSSFDADGGQAAGALEEALGLALDDLNAEFESFVGEDQQPIEPVWMEWTHRGPQSMEGFADDVFSAARLEGDASQFSAQVESPATTGGETGLLVGWSDSGPYMGVLLTGQGSVSSFANDGSGALWNTVGSVAAPGSSPVQWALAHKGAQVQITINGETLTLDRVGDPAAGLALIDAEAVFTQLSWQP